MDTARAVVRPGRQPVSDQRDTPRVGRQARLELVFGLEAGRTRLKHAYAEPPFRAAGCFPEGNGAHLILASSAPGIFGGDRLTQEIVVERGARVRLTSQSALQVHAAPGTEEARLTSAYRVEEGGRLQCEWDPLIPFASARLDQRIDIDLSDRASLLWSDAFTSGRVARDERWAFASLSYELRILRAGTLDYVERFRIRPPDGSPRRPWLAEEACCFGTVLASDAGVDPTVAARLHAEVGAIAGVRAAADRLDDHLVLVRVMAGSGARFREARELVVRELARRLRA